MKKSLSWLVAPLGALSLIGATAATGCDSGEYAPGIPLVPGGSGSGGSGPGGGGPGGGGGGGAGGGAANPCEGVDNCVRLSPSMAIGDLKEAFIVAAEGTTLAFEPGTYTIDTQLTLVGVKGVTVRGAGIDQTILDFKGATPGVGGASEGILVTDSTDFVIEKLSVRDTVGDAIKVLGGHGVTFREVDVSWTGENSTEHGAYGLYPVQCEDVLVEKCKVAGASDAGVYVGQSNRVVVRNNTATLNVAGIEIENTTSADVYQNTAEGNTGGLLVFSLPKLEVHNGGKVRLYENTVRDNNTANFAPAGNIVGLVPAGTGTFVMANQEVEVFNNTFTGNKTAQFAVISYLISERNDYEQDPEYKPFPSKIFVHNNTFENGGTQPDTSNIDGIGTLLSIGQTSQKLPTPLPPLMTDGLVPPGSPAGNPLELCFSDNQGTGANPFVNLNLSTFDRDELGQGFPSWLPIADFVPYTCTLPALPAVAIPQLAPSP